MDGPIAHAGGIPLRKPGELQRENAVFGTRSRIKRLHRRRRDGSLGRMRDIAARCTNRAARSSNESQSRNLRQEFNPQSVMRFFDQRQLRLSKLDISQRVSDLPPACIPSSNLELR